ncbi:MAG: hypothetical protein H6732_06150 [Alphaproteobacteria bacterium]|nr:hypothetical protein [Alphaproteobacteria bacterium]
MRGLGRVVVVLCAACGGGAPPADEAGTPAQALPDQVEVVKDEHAPVLHGYAQVPSPGETESALKQAGLETALHDVVPSWSFHFDKTEPNRVAVRTGVLLADLALGAGSDDDAKLLERLASVRAGLVALGVDSQMLASVDDLVERVKAQAIPRPELVGVLDRLAGVGVRQLEMQGAPQLVPLVQAGVWLEGTYCVGEAIKQHGDAAAADALLKQPAVVDYFLRYAQAQGVGGASAETAAVLFDSLGRLKAVADKAEPLAMADVEAVVAAADAVLTQL